MKQCNGCVKHKLGTNCNNINQLKETKACDFKLKSLNITAKLVKTQLAFFNRKG